MSCDSNFGAKLGKSIETILTVPLVVAYGATVQSIFSVMLIFRDMGGYALYSESAVLDAIRITTHNCTEVRMVCFSVVEVGGATVVAKNNVLGIPILVWDEEVCETGAVGYEACVDARRRDCVLGENTRALSQSSERERRHSKKSGNHVDQLCTLQGRRFGNKLGVKKLERERSREVASVTYSLYSKFGPSSI